MSFMGLTGVTLILGAADCPAPHGEEHRALWAGAAPVASREAPRWSRARAPACLVLDGPGRLVET